MDPFRYLCFVFVTFSILFVVCWERDGRLGFFMRCFTIFLLLSHVVSDVVLDCVDSVIFAFFLIFKTFRKLLHRRKTC